MSVSASSLYAGMSYAALLAAAVSRLLLRLRVLLGLGLLLLLLGGRSGLVVLLGLLLLRLGLLLLLLGGLLFLSTLGLR